MSETDVLPPDLEALRDSLKANENTLHAIVDGMSREQLEASHEGGWSILQFIDHLAIANRAYTGAMSDSIAKGVRPRRNPIRPSAAGRFFLKRIEPPVLRKMRAPRMIVPGAGRPPEEVLNAFVQSHEEIRRIIAQIRNGDVNGTKFRNPLFPLLRVRVGTGLLIMAAHERRHLWQARRIRSEVAESK